MRSAESGIRFHVILSTTVITISQSLFHCALPSLPHVFIVLRDEKVTLPILNQCLLIALSTGDLCQKEIICHTDIDQEVSESAE